MLRVLPDGCMDLNGDDVVGSLTSALMAKLEAGDETSGVRLRPGAFTALYGVPADELSDLRVPLADATLSVLSATRVTQPPAGVSEDQWAHRRRRAAVP